MRQFTVDFDRAHGEFGRRTDDGERAGRRLRRRNRDAGVHR
jgi:hypothetical protein